MILLLISPFSAIPTWEGFEDQGHIALFVVLQKIRALISTNSDTINKFILEIEGAEDFSIKDRDKYLTLHQVKSGTIDLDQDGKKDKFSFVISLLQYNADYGYFHILPNKILPNDFIQSASNWIDALLIDLDKEIKDSDEVNENDFDKYIMLNKITPNSKKGTLYNIINFVCKGSKGKEDIQKSIESIKTELITYREKLKVKGTLIDDIKFLSKYNQSFNNTQEIKESSYLIIKEILYTKKPEWNMFVDNDYIEFVYGQIFLELKNCITNDYINRKNIDKNCQIKFSTIFSKLIEDYHSDANSIKYQYFLLWKSIQNIFRQFPAKNISLCKVDLCANCDNSTNCNLYKQMKMISRIEEEDLYSFLYRLMLKEPDKGRPNNLADDNLIQRLFVSLLKEIDLLSFEKNNLIQAQKEGLFYRLTLNSSGEVHELQEQLDKEMRASLGDKLLIYENDILITDQLNEDNFIYNGINTTVIGENEYKDLQNITSDSIEKIKKNYNKPKIMRLIDRKIAKEELNKCERL